MGNTGGYAQYILINGPGRDGWQVFAATAQPGPGGLLAIHITQHDSVALMCAPCSQVGGNCAFATTSLAVDDCDHGHENS
jgi:hypothetical protein